MQELSLNCDDRLQRGFVVGNQAVGKRAQVLVVATGAHCRHVKRGTQADVATLADAGLGTHAGARLRHRRIQACIFDPGFGAQILGQDDGAMKVSVPACTMLVPRFSRLSHAS